MSVLSRRAALSCLCILAGYSVFAIYALSLRFQFDFPIEVYWLSFVLASVPLLFEAALWKSSAKLRLFYLLSFSLIIHLQFAVVDSSPFLSSADAVADYRLTSKIIADSEWMPFGGVEWGFGSEYRFYPVTNFLYATTSLLTGIPLLIVVKYLFIIKGLVVTPLAERWFRSFFTQRVAYLATGLFLASPGAILFPHKESFAVIFFFLGMYASTKTEITRRYVLIGLVSILTLILTHHFTTYIFLALLTSLFLASHFIKRQKALRVSSQFFMLCWVVFISWVAFIAWTVIVAHQRLFSQMFFSLLLPGQLAFSEVLPLYTPYERIIVWSGVGVAAFSTGLGLLGYTKNRKGFSSSFFAITLFLTTILVIASFFRFLPRRHNVLLSHRAFEFGYIVIGAFSALFFIRAFQSRKRFTLNVMLVGAIIVMMIFGPIAGALHPRSFARVSDVISFEAMALNIWISESVALNEYAIGDRIVVLLLVYGNFWAVPSPEFFASQDISLTWSLWDLRSGAGYVITYVYMKDFYGLDVAKFDNSPIFHKPYTNGMLNLYRISNRTSS